MATNQQTINNTIYYGTATFKDVNNNKCYIGSTSTESMTVSDIGNYQMLSIHNPSIYTDSTREIKYTDISVTSNLTIPLIIINNSGGRRNVNFLRIYWDGAAYVDDSAHWAVNISPGAISSGGRYETNITLPSKGTSTGRLRIQIGDFTANVSISANFVNYGAANLDDSDDNGIHNYLWNSEGSYMKMLNRISHVMITIT